MTLSEKEKMLSGALYRADAAELEADHRRACAWMARYNAMVDASAQERHALLAELFAHVGEGAVVRPPFHCDYGVNISLGRGVFLNFGCVILDSILVEIGEGAQIGPGVQILGADHPRDPAQRPAVSFSANH